LRYLQNCLAELKALEYKTYEDIYTKHKHREEKWLKTYTTRKQLVTVWFSRYYNVNTCNYSIFSRGLFFNGAPCTSACKSYNYRSNDVLRRYRSIYRVGQKVDPLRSKTHIFCLHLQNASTYFYDFWHTSMPFNFELIRCIHAIEW